MAENSGAHFRQLGGAGKGPGPNCREKEARVGEYNQPGRTGLIVSACRRSLRQLDHGFPVTARAPPEVKDAGGQGGDGLVAGGRSLLHLGRHPVADEDRLVEPRPAGADVLCSAPLAQQPEKKGSPAACRGRWTLNGVVAAKRRPDPGAG